LGYHIAAILALPVLNLPQWWGLVVVSSLAMSAFWQTRIIAGQKAAQLIFDREGTALKTPGCALEPVECRFIFVTAFWVVCRVSRRGFRLPQHYAFTVRGMSRTQWRQLHLLIRDERQ
jgi:hypothetical protein